MIFILESSFKIWKALARFGTHRIVKPIHQLINNDKVCFKAYSVNESQYFFHSERIFFDWFFKEA